MSYIKASSLGVLSRLVSAGCRFISLPLVLTLLDPVRYGLWLMLTSVLAWLSLTDLGIPAALQNPLVARLAQHDAIGAARLVRHAYGLLGRITICVGLCSVVAALTLPLDQWLKVPATHFTEFSMALATSIMLVAVTLPLRIGSILSYAMGRAELPPLADIATQVFSLALIAAFTWGRFDSLFALVVAVSGTQVLITIGLNTYLLRKSPLAGLVAKAAPLERKERVELQGKGIIFLLVLIGEGLVLQSDAFLIGAFKGPEMVTAFLVPQTLFMQFFYLQNAFLRPLWATLTAHQARGEYSRLRSLLLKGVGLSLASGAAFGLCYGLLGDWFLRIWTHGQVNVSPMMSWGFGVYAVVAAAGNVLALFCNSMGLVNRRLLGIVAFGLLKVVACAWWLQGHDITALPLIYAVVCLCTDVLVLICVVRAFFRGRERA